MIRGWSLGLVLVMSTTVWSSDESPMWNSLGSVRSLEATFSNQDRIGHHLIHEDFNSDGVTDLLALVEKDEQTHFVFYRGALNETFELVTTANQLAFVPEFAIAGDFDGDDLQDLLLAHQNHLFLLSGLGDGSFGAPAQFSLPFPVRPFNWAMRKVSDGVQIA